MGTSKNVKGNFSKTPDGIFLKSFLRMRSVLLIVYTLRFWYKTDMHPLTIFLETQRGLPKKDGTLKPKIQ
jgi:hypothetical protein